MPSNKMFRDEALDRMRSPDELDQLLTIVNRKSWMSVFALAVIVAAGLVWSIFGSIPETVNGFGVLITPGSVRGLQSTASGQIVEIRVRTGQQVRAGDVIAVLNQESLQKEYRTEQARLAELVEQNQMEKEHDDQRLRLKLSSIDVRRNLILEEIKTAEELAKLSAERTKEFVSEQTETLNETRELNVKMNQTLKQKLATVKQLLDEGLASDDTIIESESSFMESELRLANLDVEIQQLELKKIESAQSQLQQRNRLADLRLSLLDLDIESKTLEQSILHNAKGRDLRVKEQERSIERLKFLLEKQGQITSDADGRILEVTVSPGQVITEGARLGTIQLDEVGASLENLAYFPVKDGKRISPGLTVHVTPSTVQRERYGSIVGKITKVSEFPITEEGAVNVVGNPSIASALMQRGGAIEVEAELIPDPESDSGFKWTSKGPPMRFTAGTTTTVRVTIERRRPITYVLPILRTWLLGEKDDQKPNL